MNAELIAHFFFTMPPYKTASPGMLCRPTKVAAANCQALSPVSSHCGDGTSAMCLPPIMPLERGTAHGRAIERIQFLCQLIGQVFQMLAVVESRGWSEKLQRDDKIGSVMWRFLKLTRSLALVAMAMAYSAAAPALSIEALHGQRAITCVNKSSGTTWRIN